MKIINTNFEKIRNKVKEVVWLYLFSLGGLGEASREEATRALIKLCTPIKEVLDKEIRNILKLDYPTIRDERNDLVNGINDDNHVGLMINNISRALFKKK